jgi:hypothetical protein
MKENIMNSSACQIEELSKGQNEIESVGKKYFITDDQIRSLFTEFTGMGAFWRILTKVKEGEYWAEYSEAKKEYDFTDDEDYKKEYDNLVKSCNEDEIVIYDYIPFTLPEMLAAIDQNIDTYLQEEDPEAQFCGLDNELANLLLLKQIVEQNI